MKNSVSSARLRRRPLLRLHPRPAAAHHLQPQLGPGRPERQLRRHESRFALQRRGGRLHFGRNEGETARPARRPDHQGRLLCAAQRCDALPAAESGRGTGAPARDHPGAGEAGAAGVGGDAGAAPAETREGVARADSGEAQPVGDQGGAARRRGAVRGERGQLLRI